MKKATKIKTLLIATVLLLCIGAMGTLSALSGYGVSVVENVASADGELVVINNSSLSQAAASYSNYDPDGYIRISTAAEFIKAFKYEATSAASQKNFRLHADFAVNTAITGQGSLPAGYSWFDTSDAGNFITQFAGTLDGNGHTITFGALGYEISSNTSYFGVMFDRLLAASVISNLGFSNNAIITISSTGDSFVGSFAGSNAGTINTCSLYNNGNISLTNPSGNLVMGGIIGLNSGDINNSKLEGREMTLDSTTSGTRTLGGIIGVMNGGTINNTQLNSRGSFISYSQNESNSNIGVPVSGGVIGRTNTGFNVYDSTISVNSTFSIVQDAPSEYLTAGGFIGAVQGGTVNLERNFWDLGSNMTLETAGGDNRLNVGRTSGGGLVGKVIAGTINLKDSVLRRIPSTPHTSALNSGDEYIRGNDGALIGEGNFTLGDNVWLVSNNNGNANYSPDGTQSSAIRAALNVVRIYGSGVVDARIASNGKITLIPVKYEYSNGATPFHSWQSQVGDIGVFEYLSTTNLSTNTEYHHMNQYKDMPGYVALENSKGVFLNAVFMFTKIYRQYEITQFAMDMNNGLNWNWVNVEIGDAGSLLDPAQLTFVQGMPSIGNAGRPFRGTFNGNGNTITFMGNSIIYGNNNVGFFGVNRGIISNFNINFYGSMILGPGGDSVQSMGIVCGANYNQISNVNVTIGSRVQMITENLDYDTVRTVNIGGAVGTQSQAVAGAKFTDSNIVNYADMKVIYNVYGSSTLDVNMGGAFGAIYGGVVENISVELQAAMTTNTDKINYRMGGFVGYLNPSTANATVNTIAISVGNKSTFSDYATVFNPRNLSGGQSQPRAFTIEGSRVNNVGYFAGGVSLNSGLFFNTNNYIWICKHSPTDVAVAYNSIGFNNLNSSVTIANIGSATTGINPNIKNLYVEAPELYTLNGVIYRDVAVLSVTIDKSSGVPMIRIGKSELKEGTIFTGWFKQANYSGSVTQGEGAYGDFFIPVYSFNSTVYTKIMSNLLDDIQDLIDISNIVNSGNSFLNTTFYLKNDITYSGGQFTTIGYSSDLVFQGTINGNGYKLTFDNVQFMSYGASSNYGFIGHLGHLGSIYNLDFVLKNIVYSDNNRVLRNVGGLVCVNYGTVGIDNYHMKTTVTIENSTLFGSTVGAVVARNAIHTSSGSAGKVLGVEVNVVNSNLIATYSGASVGALVGENSNGASVKGGLVKVNNQSLIQSIATVYSYAGGAIGYNNTNGIIDSVVSDIKGNVVASQVQGSSIQSMANGAVIGYNSNAQPDTESLVTRTFMIDNNTSLKPDGRDENYIVSNTIGVYYQGYASQATIGSISVGLQGATLTFVADAYNADARPFYKWQAESADGSVTPLSTLVGAVNNTFSPINNDYFTFKNSRINAYFVKTDIDSVEDYKNLANDVNIGYSPYVNYVLTKAISINTANYVRIGTEENPFNGNFTAYGNTITIQGVNTFTGLFGYVSANSEIYNLGLDISGTVAGAIAVDANVGLIALVNNGLISKVTVNINNNITARRYIGGIASINNGSIINATVNLNNGTIAITDTVNIGAIGLVAAINNGIIGMDDSDDLYSIRVKISLNSGISVGSVRNGTMLGAVVGHNTLDAVIYDTSLEFNGFIIADNYSTIIGGIASVNDGLIQDIRLTTAALSVMYAKHNVNDPNAKSYVGGVIGRHEGALNKAEINSNGAIGIYGGQRATVVGGIIATMLADSSAINITANINNSVSAIITAGGMVGEAFTPTKTHDDISGNKIYYINNVVINVNGAVNAGTFAGGLIGENHTNINAVTAYINGNITATAAGFAGGLIGDNESINPSFPTGYVDNTFVDLNSNISGAVAGTVAGRTTQLMSINTWVVSRNDINIKTSTTDMDNYNSMRIVGSQKLVISVVDNEITFGVLEKDKADFYNWYQNIKEGRLMSHDEGVLTQYTFKPSRLINNVEYHVSFYKLNISTADELNDLARNVNSNRVFSNVKITLMNDIEIDSTKLFVPIGTLSNPFNGIFDGLEKTITFKTGSTISSVAYSGLFGYIASNASVYSLKLEIEEGVNIAGKNSLYAGNFVGYNAGKLSNIVVNAYSVALGGTYRGAFAGVMAPGSVAQNVWIVTYNASINTTSDNNYVIVNDEMQSEFAYGINKLSVIGIGKLDVSLIQSEISFVVQEEDGYRIYNQYFYGWLKNSEDNLKLTTANGNGQVVSDPALTLFYRPLNAVADKLYTLSFIKLEIDNAADYKNFVTNVNEYSGFSNVTFRLTQNILIDGNTTMINNQLYNIIDPIGLSDIRPFDGILDGNNMTITFKNVTFNTGFAAMFGYVTSNAVVRNLIIQSENNIYGAGDTQLTYASVFAAFFAGTADKVIVNAGNNTYNGIVRTIFAGTLGQTASVTNSFAIMSEFSLYNAVGNSANPYNVNTIKVAGYGDNYGRIETTLTSAGAIIFNFISENTQYHAYMSKNGADFDERVVTEYTPSGGTDGNQPDINGRIMNDSGHYVNADGALVGNIISVAFVKLEISSIEDLIALSAQINLGINYSGIVYSLMNNIVIVDDFTPIGGIIGTRYDNVRSYFSGKFNGNGNTITIASTCTIVGEYAAIFGEIDSNASIYNLYVNHQGVIGDEDTKNAAVLVANASNRTDTDLQQLDNILISITQNAKIIGSNYVARAAARYYGSTSNVWVVVYNSSQNDLVLSSSDFEANGVNTLTIIGDGAINANMTIDAESTQFVFENAIPTRLPLNWYRNFGYSNGMAITNASDVFVSNVTVDNMTLNTNKTQLVVVNSSNASIVVNYLNRTLSNATQIAKLSDDILNDYDYYGIEFTLNNNITINNNVGIAPIGSLEKPFTAVINGLGRSITLTGGLDFSDYEYSGFFGYIGSTGVLKNLKIIADDILVGSDISSYAAVIAYNAGTLDTVVIETYGVKTELTTVDQLDNANYAGGISFSESLNIINTWAIISTSNMIEGIKGENSQGAIAMKQLNRLIVIGRGTIETIIAPDGQITFKEKLIPKNYTEADYKFVNWYHDFVSNTVISANDAYGEISKITETSGGKAYELTTFKPSKNSTNSMYEVALLHLSIESVEDINAIAADVNNGGYTLIGRTFRFRNNISLQAGDNTPIGLIEHIFKGTIDGNGYTLSYESGNSYNPLFNVNSGALVDLNIDISCEIINIEDNIIAIIAENNNGIINNVAVNITGFGSIRSNQSIGLMVGLNNLKGVISNSSVNINGNIQSYVGDVGLVAITNRGQINGLDVVLNSSIEAGLNAGTIVYNYNVMQDAVIKLFTYNINIDNPDEVSINTNGVITANNYVGGLAAINEGTVSSAVVYAYNSNLISIGRPTNGVGILAGSNIRTMSNTWAINIANDPVNLGLSGGSIDNTNGNRLFISGMGIINATAQDGVILFTKGEGVNKSIYGWFDSSKRNIAFYASYGNVAENSYLPNSAVRAAIIFVEFINNNITSVEDWLAVVEYVNQGYSGSNARFELANDLVFGEGVFKTVGTAINNFNYLLDGKNRTITINGYTDTLELSGVFGYLGQDANIYDLNIVINGDFGSMSSLNTAAFAATSYGILNNISVTINGAVLGKNVAGLVVNNLGDISNSNVSISNQGSLNGSIAAAGVAVRNNGGTISNVIVNIGGDITAISGGDATITGSYAAGAVVFNIDGFIGHVKLNYNGGRVVSSNIMNSYASAFNIENSGIIRNIPLLMSAVSLPLYTGAPAIGNISQATLNNVIILATGGNTTAAGLVITNAGSVIDVIIDMQSSYIKAQGTTATASDIAIYKKVNETEAIISNVWAVVTNMLTMQSASPSVNIYVINPEVNYSYTATMQSGRLVISFNVNLVNSKFIAYRLMSKQGVRLDVLTRAEGIDASYRIYSPQNVKSLIVMPEMSNTISSANEYYVFAGFANYYQATNAALLSNVTVYLTRDIVLDSSKIVPISITNTSITGFEFSGASIDGTVSTLTIVGPTMNAPLFASLNVGYISKLIVDIQCDINGTNAAALVNNAVGSSITEVTVIMRDNKVINNGNNVSFMTYTDCNFMRNTYVVADYDSLYTNDILKASTTHRNTRYLAVRGDGLINYRITTAGALIYTVNSDTDNGHHYVGYLNGETFVEGVTPLRSSFSDSYTLQYNIIIDFIDIYLADADEKNKFINDIELLMGLYDSAKLPINVWSIGDAPVSLYEGNVYEITLLGGLNANSYIASNITPTSMTIVFNSSITDKIRYIEDAEYDVENYTKTLTRSIVFIQYKTAIESLNDYKDIVNNILIGGMDYDGLTIQLLANIILDSQSQPITNFKGSFNGNGYSITLYQDTYLFDEILTVEGSITNIVLRPSGNTINFINNIANAATPNLPLSISATINLVGAVANDFIVIKNVVTDNSFTSSVATLNINEAFARQASYAYTYKYNRIDNISDWTLLANSVDAGISYRNKIINLESNLDFNSTNFRQLGSLNTFEGTFNGKSNLISTSVNQYLFGKINSNTTLQNFTVVSTNNMIKFIGNNNGIVKNVTVTTNSLISADNNSLMHWYGKDTNDNTLMLASNVNKKNLAINSTGGYKVYDYTVVLNTISTYAEFMAFANSTSNGSYYEGITIELLSSIDISGATDSLIKNFKGILNCNFNVITLTNMSASFISVFSSLDNLATINKLIVWVNDDSLAHNKDVIFTDSGDEATVYEVYLIADNSQAVTMSGGNNAKSIIISGAGNTIVTANQDNFSIMTYPKKDISGNGVWVPQFNSDISFGFTETSGYTLWAGYGKNADEYGLDVYSYLITELETDTIYINYNKKYLVEAYIGVDTLIKGYGVYASGESVPIDVTASKIKDLLLVDNNVTLGSNLVYVVGNSDYKLQFIRIDASGVSTVYNASTQVYNANALRDRLALGASFTFEFMYFNNEDLNYTNPLTPRNAGEYAFYLTIKRDGYTVGVSSMLPFIINKAPVFDKLTVFDKTYDGSATIGSNGYDPKLKLLGSDILIQNYVRYNNFALEYATANAGNNIRIRLIGDITCYEDNYYVETDSNGYIMINGVYVTGSINPKSTILTGRVGNLVMEYDKGYVNSAYLNAKGLTLAVDGGLSSIKIGSNLSVNNIKDNEYYAITIDGVKFYAALNIKNVFSGAATYRSVSNGQFAELVSIADDSNNYLPINLNTTTFIVTVQKKAVVLSVGEASKLYNNSFTNFTSMVNVEDLNGNKITNDTFNLKVSKQAGENVGAYNITVQVFEGGVNIFNRDNPNYVLDINSFNATARDEILNNGTFTKTGAFTILSRPLVIVDIAYNSKNYGFVGNTMVAFTNAAVNSKHPLPTGFVVEVTAMHNGVNVVSSVSIPSGSYDYTIRILNANKQDVTGNFTVSLSNNVAAQYMVSPLNAEIIESSIKVVNRNADGTVDIEFNIKQSGRNGKVLLDNSGKPLVFTATTSLPNIVGNTYEDVAIDLGDINFNFSDNFLSGSGFISGALLNITDLTKYNLTYEDVISSNLGDYITTNVIGDTIDQSMYEFVGFEIVSGGTPVDITSLLNVGTYSLRVTYRITDPYTVFSGHNSDVQNVNLSSTISGDGKTITLTINQVIVVNPLSISLSLGTANITYGDPLNISNFNSVVIRNLNTNALIADANAFFASLNATLSYDLSAGSNKEVTLTVKNTTTGNLSGNNNYLLTATNFSGLNDNSTGLVNISKRTLTITVLERDYYTINYGDDLPRIHYRVNGLADGDVIDGSMSLIDPNASLPGKYQIAEGGLRVRRDGRTVTSSYNVVYVISDEIVITIVGELEEGSQVLRIILIIVSALGGAAVIGLGTVSTIYFIKKKKLKLKLNTGENISLEGEEDITNNDVE